MLFFSTCVICPIFSARVIFSMSASISISLAVPTRGWFSCITTPLTFEIGALALFVHSGDDDSLNEHALREEKNCQWQNHRDDRCRQDKLRLSAVEAVKI